MTATATETQLTCTINRSSFVDALTICAKVVPARSPKPVLTGVLIEASEGMMTLTATDLEVTVRVEVAQVDITEPGRVLVPAAKLVAIVRRFSGTTFTMRCVDDKLTLTDTQGRADLYTMPPSDYPSGVVSMDTSDTVNLAASDLTAMLGATMPATSHENSRYAINGVYLAGEKGKLVAVATDGHRLHLYASPVACPDTFKAIVPTRACGLLVSLCRDPEAEVSIGVDPARARVQSESWCLWSNLIDGNFPPYRDVIPKGQDKRAAFDCEAFVWALGLASEMTNTESKGVRLSFEKGEVTITARAPEMGEADATAPLKDYTGDPLEIGFNPQYLMDTIKAANTDSVTLDLSAANKPGTVRGGCVTAVIMPLNLQ